MIGHFELGTKVWLCGYVAMWLCGNVADHLPTPYIKSSILRTHPSSYMCRPISFPTRLQNGTVHNKSTTRRPQPAAMHPKYSVLRTSTYVRKALPQFVTILKNSPSAVHAYFVDNTPYVSCKYLSLLSLLSVSGTIGARRKDQVEEK